LANHAAEYHGVHAEVAADPASAVQGASIVCTTTASREPVLEGAWLAPGAHVNAVGACIPTARELDSNAVVRSKLYVDRRESALAEPGDILIPLQDGEISPSHLIAEIGELLIDDGARRLGRQSDDEITLFKSLGLAVEDLAAAHFLYDKAIREGAGHHVSLGGLREPLAHDAHDIPAGHDIHTSERV
jgi:ornithine cyclodeaminase/alanine dehydrogenase-like protein (mu-crystallin family)